MSEPAIKRDEGKTRLDLLSAEAIEELGRVLTFGATKYAAHNWRKGLAYSRVHAAAMRHLLAFARGEDRDEETGLLHTAHAMCCLMFLVEYQLLNRGVDDRWRP